MLKIETQKGSRCISARGNNFSAEGIKAEVSCNEYICLLCFPHIIRMI